MKCARNPAAQTASAHERIASTTLGSTTGTWLSGSTSTRTGTRPQAVMPFRASKPLPCNLYLATSALQPLPCNLYLVTRTGTRPQAMMPFRASTAHILAQNSGTHCNLILGFTYHHPQVSGSEHVSDPEWRGEGWGWGGGEKQTSRIQNKRGLTPFRL